MNQIESANRFVEAMCQAEGRLAHVKAAITSQKDKTAAVIARFKQTQGQIVNQAQREIKNEQSQVIFKTYRDELQKALNEQDKSFAEFINGTKFIESFEETFIVCIFGKVKSGKSYLGNYIMGNPFKKNGLHTEYNDLGKISVTVYDRGKITTQDKLTELENQGEFGVASTEATSTIQYFKIGGLTWFDTPGVGSITKENEELAEEYVKNADLVVFCMNSDAAGTTQEVAELNRLHNNGKPMLLLVTQSDTSEWDVDDNGKTVYRIVPKTKKDRDDVENYLLEQLREEGLSKALDLNGNKVLTVSTKLACEALTQKDRADELYAGSNIDDFVKRLIEITISEAAQLKEKNPKSRFNALIQELTQLVDGVNRQVEAINVEAQRVQTRAEKVKVRVVNNVRLQALGVIREKIHQAEAKMSADSESSSKGASNRAQSSLFGSLFGGNSTAERSKSRESGVADVATSGGSIAQAVTAEINKIIENECIEGLQELIPDVSVKNVGGLINSSEIKLADMQEKKVNASYEVTFYHRRRVQDGFMRGLRDIVFGAEYRTVTTKETRTIEVAVGNNADELEDQLLAYFEGTCERKLNQMIDSLIEGCVKPLNAVYTGFSKLNQATKNDLRALIMK